MTFVCPAKSAWDLQKAMPQSELFISPTPATPRAKRGSSYALRESHRKPHLTGATCRVHRARPAVHQDATRVQPSAIPPFTERESSRQVPG